MATLSLDQFAAALANPEPGAGLVSPEGGGAVAVDLDGELDVALLSRVHTLAAVLVAVTDEPHHLSDVFDVVVSDPDEVVAAVDATPLAATALALLLRSTAALGVADALVAESATYSLLQAGPEHQAWLDATPRRDKPDESDVVRVERDGEALHIALSRPQVRNAFNAAMRDGLLDALALAASDATITRVHIDGDGPAFCSGGDLNEFGTLTNPAAAHILRVARNVGRAVHELAERVTVTVHGSCVGAGVEVPAFAGHVIARPDATFRLPEVSMGLVPGAGGTVSIPRRIGRQRTAWLALTGQAIDAATALDWGLVDAISEQGSRE